MTNKGLSLTLMLTSAQFVLKQVGRSIKRYRNTAYSEAHPYFAPLNCYTVPKPFGQRIQIDRNDIPLQLQRSAEARMHQYARLSSDTPDDLPSSAIPSKWRKEQIFAPPEPVPRNVEL